MAADEDADKNGARLGKSILGRLAGVFVETSDGDAPSSDETTPDFDALSGATDAAADATGTEPAASRPKPDIRDVAFSDAYSQTGGADASTDQLLAAAARLGGKAVEVQQAAMEATAAAISADIEAVARVVATRQKALSALVATARKRGSEAQTSRTTALNEQTAGDAKRIEELRAEIVTIEIAIATRNAEATKTDTMEAAKQAKFEERVKAESDRLTALATILAPAGGK